MMFPEQKGKGTRAAEEKESEKNKRAKET